MGKSKFDDINRNIYDIKNEDNYDFKIKKGLTKEIVDEISRQKNEPEWMREFRLKAIDVYNKLELPTWGPDISELNMDDIATYDTVYEKSRLINIGEEIRTGSIDCVVFTSASTVKGFVESTGLADYSGVVAACIGKQTKAAADAYGMQTYVAEKATIEALIELVVKIKNK